MADCYLTASWDRSLRLWNRPDDPRRGGGDDGSAVAVEGPAPNMLLLEYDEDEDTSFVSEYEKAHPLEVPRALTEVRGEAPLTTQSHSGWAHGRAWRVLPRCTTYVPAMGDRCTCTRGRSNMLPGLPPPTTQPSYMYRRRARCRS